MEECNLSIEINLKSKKFCCSFSIKEKLTFIRGDSGVGKTEFTRRVSSRTSANHIDVSNGFELSVLTTEVFENIYRKALSQKNKDESTKNQEETKFLRKFWSTNDNFPFSDNMIFIIDDDDFVKTHAFAVLFECDKSNYYIIINRSNLPSLSYSADEVYNFVSDGINHTLEKYYSYMKKTIDTHLDMILVEGIGSDFIFFQTLFSNGKVLKPNDFNGIHGGGKDNLIKALKENIILFYHKSIFLIIDFCGFGSNIEDLINLAKDYNVTLFVNRDYLSFEYFLLKSNLIKDDIDDFIEKNRLKFYSLEDLCTQRLIFLTRGTLYPYSKSNNSFSSCYYLDCCSNINNNGNCDIRRSKLAKDKVKNMIIDTDFEYFLSCI